MNLLAALTSPCGLEVSPLEALRTNLTEQALALNPDLTLEQAEFQADAFLSGCGATMGELFRGWAVRGD